MITMTNFVEIIICESISIYYKNETVYAKGKKWLSVRVHRQKSIFTESVGVTDRSMRGR